MKIILFIVIVIIVFVMLGMWGLIDELGDTVSILKEELHLHGCPISDEELNKKVAVRKYERKNRKALR